MARTGRTVLSDVWRFRNLIIVILTPIVLLPLPLLVDGKEARCGYLLILMAVFWVSEALPLAITSLIPIFLLPLFSIISTMAAAQAFVSGPTMLFIGANVIALAIEKTNLHRRLAFRILLTIGVRPKRLMLGFMLTSWFLSMWMCNTATTCMLLPILESVLRHIEPSGDGNNAAGMSDCSRKMAEFEEPHKTCCGDGAKSIKFDKPEASSSLPGLTIMQEKDDQEPVMVVDVVQPDTAGVTEYNTTGVTESSPSLLPRGYADMSPEEFRKLSVGLTLTICFAANIGGVATINGAIPNMIMKGAADSLWQNNLGETSPIHFTSWAAFGIPIAVINLIFLWFWMNSFYLGVRYTFGCFSRDVGSIEDDAAVETYLRREREQLGPVSVDQILVTLSLVALVALWVFREPGFMDGWGSYFPKSFMGDATPAVLIGLLPFVIPANLTGSSGKGGTVPTLMDWDTMQRRFPWSVVLLMGGGFTLAKACAASGLSKWVGDHLDVFDDLPRWFMLFVILIMVALLTEVTSNPAACSLLMPIVAPLAMKMGLNPLYLMYPVCFATSFAFMLPAASPPNAIVFCYGRLRTIDMIMAGAVLNVVCVATVVLGTETWGMALFDLATPPWNASAVMTAATGSGM